MEEADVECQTDAFLDRPPTPLFVPAKTGVDNTTQILDGEVRLTFLFHFWGMILIITEQSEENDLQRYKSPQSSKPPSICLILITFNFKHIKYFQLFDFDIEVKPILEVLVGKTIEQALMEVMEEEELANLRAQQVSFILIILFTSYIQ